MLKLPSIKQSVSFIIIIGTCGLMLAPKTVMAQVNVSPLVISTQAKQGTATGFITLVNASNAVATMKLSAKPFILSGAEKSGNPHYVVVLT